MPYRGGRAWPRPHGAGAAGADGCHGRVQGKDVSSERGKSQKTQAGQGETPLQDASGRNSGGSAYSTRRRGKFRRREVGNDHQVRDIHGLARGCGGDGRGVAVGVAEHTRRGHAPRRSRPGRPPWRRSVPPQAWGAAPCERTSRVKPPCEGWSRRPPTPTLEAARHPPCGPQGGKTGGRCARREMDQREDPASAERRAGTAPHRGPAHPCAHHRSSRARSAPPSCRPNVRDADGRDATRAHPPRPRRVSLPHGQRRRRSAPAHGARLAEPAMRTTP